MALVLCVAMSNLCGAASNDSGTTGPKVPRSQAFFGIHLDLHPQAGDTTLGSDATAENIGTFLDRVKPDFMQYDCKGHAGYTGYKTEVGWASPGIVNDALALWRQETRKRGMGLYIHYSGVWDTVAIEKHPEWAVTNADGSKDPNATSLFGRYVDDLLIPQLKEVCGKYDLDGVWVDGDCWASKFDYGTTAALAWKDYTGTTTLPKKSGEPNWQKWKAFQRDKFETYLTYWVDALHEFNPALELCSNWAYSPHMPLPIRTRVDFISGDYPAKESADRARFEARYLESNQKPWDLMAWGFNGFAGNNGFQQWKTADQLKQELAVVLALGGGMQIYYQPTRAGYMKDSIREIAGEVADFCRQRQAFSFQSEPVPQVALLLSETTYFKRMDGMFAPGGQYTGLEGALQALLESGYSVEMMAEHQLTGRMKDYPVIVLAQSEALPNEFHEELLDYVRGGGSLVLMDPQSAVPFSKYLGVTLTKSTDAGNNLCYIGSAAGTAPAVGAWWDVKTTGAILLETRGGIDWQGDWNTLEEASAVSVNVGNGNVIVVAGPVAAAYYQSHHPVVRKWLAGLMEKVFREPRARVMDNPNVDMALRKLKDGRQAVHLVNLSGCQRADRFAAVEKVPPSGPVTVQWVVSHPGAKFEVLPEGKCTARKIGNPSRWGTLYEITVENVPIHAALVAKQSP